MALSGGGRKGLPDDAENVESNVNDRRVARRAGWILAALVPVWGCGRPAAPRPTSAPTSAPTAASDAPTPPYPIDIERAIARVFPAIVRLDVVIERAADGRMRKERGFGSGVIIRPDGYLITNHHVAGRARRIRCRLATGEEIEGRIVGTDPLADVTVVRLNMEQRKGSDPLPTAEFGDSDALCIGDTVLAMGSPGGVSQSVTRGIVSNTALMLPGGALTLDGENVGSLVRWVAHDAPIFGGNSGGALVDLEGRVVGINEIGFAGIGGAIPGNLARSIAEQIIEKGYVERSWIGVMVQTRPQSFPAERGVLVASVFSGSPGEEAGLEAGDVLLKYDGVDVDGSMPEELPLFNILVQSTLIGKEVDIRYLRQGEERDTRLQTRRRDPALGRDRALRDWGMTARNFTILSALAMLRDSTDGVIVSSVSAGGPAAQAEPPLRPGDVITAVAGEAVANLEALEDRTEKWLEGREEARPMLVAFERGRNQFLSVARVGPPPQPDRPERAKRPDFPAVVQAVPTSLAEALRLPDAGGLRIAYVFPGMSVDRAGLRVGDIITRFDGMPVRARRPEDAAQFVRQIRARKIGAVIPVEILRDGETLQLDLTLAESADTAAETDRYEARLLDFDARALTLQDRALRKLPDNLPAVLIERVEPASAANLAGLRVGDLLISLADEATSDIATLEGAVKKLEKEKPRFVLLFVRRGVNTMYLEVEPDWTREDAGGTAEAAEIAGDGTTTEETDAAPGAVDEP